MFAIRKGYVGPMSAEAIREMGHDLPMKQFGRNDFRRWHLVSDSLGVVLFQYREEAEGEIARLVALNVGQVAAGQDSKAAFGIVEI